MSAFVFALLSFLTLTPSFASGFRPQVEARSDGTLVINHQIALRIHVSASGNTPRVRAEEIAGRLADLSGPQKIKVVPVNRRNAAIETTGGRLIIMVTRADARFEDTELGALARHWASRIGSLLSQPPLTLSASHGRIIVPTGESRSVLVGGFAAASAVSAQGSPSSTVKATFDPNSRKLTLQGVSAGRAQVVVTASDGIGGQAQISLVVVVEDPAASIGHEADARVTGSPATPKALVIQAVYNALYRILTPQAGAKIELLESPDITKDLAAGNSVTIPV
ncbi:MAG TPA: hypothetical protein VFW40_07765, partial [Capsulimonadaceae bacterium]|nr:hypothetical protein [Capsulimonadaceae bacterium]